MISAASEISPVGLAAAVMIFAFMLAVAMDLPIKWVVSALAGFALINGYILSATLGVAIVLMFHSRWEQILVTVTNRFETNFPEWNNLRGARDKRWFGNERRRFERRGKGNSGTRSGHSEHHWGSRTHSRTESRFGRGKPRTAPSAKASPETILGLSGDFTMKDLDAARRRLAKKFHPDLHRRASIKKQEHMATKMRTINAAYETLKRQMQRPVRA